MLFIGTTKNLIFWMNTRFRFFALLRMASLFLFFRSQIDFPLCEVS